MKKIILVGFLALSSVANAQYNPLAGFMWCRGASPVLPATLPAQKEIDVKYKADVNGVPMYTIRDKDEYHPVFMMHMAWKSYSQWIVTKDDGYAVLPLKVADWLVANQDQNTGYWRYPFSYTVSGTVPANAPAGTTGVQFEAGWGSAMAQGFAIGLLARVAALKGPEAGKAYLEAAHMGLKPFDVPVSRGGLLVRLDGRPWYEEYPTPKPSYVLNGFIYSLFGLYDMATLHKDVTAQRLYDNGLNTLKYALPKYDVPEQKKNWYHLAHLTMGAAPYLANKEYQPLHATQLKMLQCIKPDPVLNEWQLKWEGYLAPQSPSTK
ncbi:D-glucuronyl C5-epimerase family protein [Deinococcus antarcticus]|uniref:D-glucuronyl C5-epimerase family protein n=1 Tax=Deinococcus antarcticus TaxID=1298767 RepID=A0ABV8A1Y5_9DEIO